MVTEVDFGTIKNKIIQIIKADNTLFDESNKAGDRFRSVDLGVPDAKNWLNEPMPYCRVTNNTDLDVAKPFGGVVGTAVSATYHIMQFLIIVVAQEKDSKTVEQTLDTIHKKLLERLKADHTLGGTVKTSFPIRTRQLASGTFDGKSVDGFEVLLQVETVTN